MLFKKSAHFVYVLKYCYLVIGVFLIPIISLAQTNIITGTLTDELGKPINGVSVTIKNSTTGTTTNSEGNFSVTAAKGDVLVFTAVGYETVEKTISDNAAIKITLNAVAGSLDDVVVVGYGVQKKINLTGSVSTVTAKEIENRPVTNLSSSLAGLVPGAYIYQTSGAPGSDGASIQIRGNSTLSSTSPLIIVDGVIAGINTVNPNDVESVTVLKDAASVAIYGTMGANGVILITTKMGGRTNSRPIISYSGIFSTVTPTGVPKFVTNSVEYMQLMNEGYRNSEVTIPFDSATTITQFADAAMHPNDLTALGVPNYVAYPNTDWSKVIFQHHVLQNHNISVSGNNNGTRYLLSLGYLNDPGLVVSSGYQKYQIRANVESKVGKFLTVGTQTYASLGYYGLFDQDNLLNFLVQASPTTYPYYNGKYGSTSAAGDKIGQAQNLLYYTKSYTGSKPETYINTTWYAKVQILKGLTFEPKFNYTTDFTERNYSDNPIPSERWNFATMQLVTPITTSANLSTYSYFAKEWSYTLESLLRYGTTINGKHNINALAGFNQYYTQNYSTSVSGKGLIDPSIPALSTATSFPTNPSGSATDWSMRSFFGRVNYDYLQKYLFEFNLRSDASSRFGPSYRVGNFPSVSVGWNLTQEPFLSSLKENNIQNLKLRASWGKAGNTYVPNSSNGYTNYQWQALYNSIGYSFGGAAINGLYQAKIPNPFLHWETTEQTTIGLDLLAFRKLDVSVDWFHKHTTDILFTPTIDPTSGIASAPVGNFSAMAQNGIELDANWHQKAGDFFYSVGGNLTYNYGNKVLNYKGPLQAGWTTDASGNLVYSTNLATVSSGGNNRILEGHMINEFYLQTVYHGDGTYKSGGAATPTNGPKEGMIRTTDDLAWVNAMMAAHYHFQPVDKVGKSQLYYGDLIYADNNKDSTFGNANDAQCMNFNTSPKFIFGFTINLAWKGFDFSMLWAGATGKKYLWNQTYFNSTKVLIGGQIPERIANDHYYYNDVNPNDPSNNITADFPRLKQSDAIDNIASDYWFYDASYLKLKNFQLGYNIPVKRIGSLSGYIQSIRLYFSGENLLTITKYPGPDPEAGTAVGYPLLKQYAFGINVSF